MPKHKTLRRMMSHRFLTPLLIPLMGAAPAFGATEPVPCADHFIVASAVQTPSDVEAFVQCAYEYVQEMGFEEARRAFNEDERWKSLPTSTYIFVDEMTPVPGAARAFVYPPRPSQEGVPWGDLTDIFGSDIVLEFLRILNSFDEGWTYYRFLNPATGTDALKAAYFKAIDWNGVPAAIGSGIYQRDIPVTCRKEEVNATMLAAYPSDMRLREFVRCAAMELESMGYFSIISLSVDPRWRGGSIYLFGLDTYGNTLFSGDPYSRWFGTSTSELDSSSNAAFGGRDLLGVADAFGESFLYYSTRNPATGKLQRKVTFVKRVVSFGVPVLVGAGYYLEDMDTGMSN